MSETKTTAPSVIVVVPKTEVISTASIDIYKVELYKGLKAVVKAFDGDKKLLKAWEVSVEGDEYQNWTDDSQLEELLLSKVGLTRMASASDSLQ